MSFVIATSSVLFLLSGALAGALIDAKPVVKSTDECLAEYGIDKDLIYNRDESQPAALTNEQVYCVPACVYRDMGIMRSNGTIDEQKAKTFFGSEDSREKDIFFAVHGACKQGRVACKLVQCMFQELKNHWSITTDSDMMMEKSIFSKGSLGEHL